MIWRDDDVGASHVNHAGLLVAGTKIEDLIAADDLFQKYGLPHTIAVMAKDMDTRPDLVDAIRERGMCVQLHCWTHDDLTASQTARDELSLARELVADVFGRVPTVLYPPWNRSDDVVQAVAAKLGMRVSHRKASLSQYVGKHGGVAERTVNFHHWAPQDMRLLEEALRIEASLQ